MINAIWGCERTLHAVKFDRMWLLFWYFASRLPRSRSATINYYHLFYLFLICINIYLYLVFSSEKHKIAISGHTFIVTLICRSAIHAIKFKMWLSHSHFSIVKFIVDFVVYYALFVFVFPCLRVRVWNRSFRPYRVWLWRDAAEWCRHHCGRCFVVVDSFVNHLVQFEWPSVQLLPTMPMLLPPSSPSLPDRIYSMNTNCPSIRNWTSCVQYCRENALFALDTVRHHQNYKSTLYTNNHIIFTICLFYRAVSV